MPKCVYIALGSNLGDRQDFLKKAINAFAPDITTLRASHIYQTPPWGFTDQPSFLNQVVETETDLEPEALLQKLKSIEKSLGRVETVRYGPRCIDLDILFYGNDTYSSEKLVIPHPMIPERAFVLVPMNELAPDYVHPQLNLSISTLLGNLDPDGIEIYKEEESDHETA
jgi:2-amino-4-hydroxy-6-hydroxymethyldihydropteridine diphosphokinase